MSNLFDRLRGSTNDYLIDHPKTKTGLNWTFKFLIAALSGFIFAYGFRAFIAPTSECLIHWGVTDPSKIASPTHLISGGASGMSQTIIRFIEIFVDVRKYETQMTSILYFVINIPLILLAFFKISKQFTAFTLINVGFVSLFNYIIPDSWIYNVVNIYDDLIARCIFGGITTGVSSVLAMVTGNSAGGSDIISIYISEKKSSTVGKYSFFINGSIILFYSTFSVIGNIVNPAWNTNDKNTIITLTLYTIVYFFVNLKVLDLFNIKHKKQKIEIFTTNENLPLVLIRSFPHSCSTLEAKGAYTGQKKTMIVMIISKAEKNKVIKMVKAVDPFAFITLTDINQVYGRFYIKPLQ